MRSKRMLIAAVAGAVLFAAGAAQAAGDPVAGKTKFYTCMGCHGVKGYNSAYPTFHVPKLGGQHAQYIVQALTEYKTGKRSFPTMQAQASSLSKQDMEDIAAYLSQQK